MERRNKSSDLLSSNVPAFYVCILYAFGLFLANRTQITLNTLLFLTSSLFVVSFVCNRFFKKNSISLVLLLFLFVTIGLLRAQTLYHTPTVKKNYVFYTSQNKCIPKNRLIEVTILSNQFVFKETMKGIIKIPESVDTIYANKYYTIFIHQKNKLDKNKHHSFINKNHTFFFIGEQLIELKQSSLESLIASHQKALRQKVIKLFTDTTLSSLVMGLLIGEKNDLPYEVTQSFKTVGAMHILAVSGMHTALLFQVFSFLFIPIGHYKINRIVRCILLTAILIYFCLLSNNASSIVRATIMCIVLCVGTIQNKSTNSLNTLGISGLIILFIQPNQLWDIGFQLSFVAVMGILYANYLYQQYTIPKGMSWIAQTLLFTFCAQLFTLPILLYHFHTFSTYFLVSNLLLIPLSTCCIFLALFLLITQPLFIWSQSLLDWFYYPFNWFIKISQHIAQWNYAWIEGISLSPTFLFIHLLVVVFLVVYRNISHQLVILSLFLGLQLSMQYFNSSHEKSINHYVLGYTSHLITQNGQGLFIGTKKPSPNYLDYIKSKYNLYQLSNQTINPYKSYQITFCKKSFVLKATKFTKIKYIR